MSSIVLKLLASMVSLVVMPFTLLLVLASTGFNGLFNYATLILTPIFIAIWIVIWRRDVSWTRRRIVMMIASTVLSGAIATVIGIVPYAINGFAHLEGVTFWIGWAYYYVWITAALACWRETKSERTSRLARDETSGVITACPTCGHNMTGLREAKCPECGTSFTLDQLHRAGNPTMRY